ncbi:MAG: hypothetical protein IJN90_05905 [Bacilli bacterium]|nr:hypothetical protein [Bacilli bacterium]
MIKLKFCLMTFVLSFLMLPYYTFANECDEFEIVSENTKYYKTISIINNNLYLLKSNIKYNSFEITEEEYNRIENNSTIVLSNYSGITETTYKKMTTTISTNGNYYRYKIVLNWKNMPATGSYDIIGIGFLGSVKVRSSLNFTQEYCRNSGGCITSTTNYPQTFNYGAGTTFKLPTDSIYSLKQTLYFDVEKNTSSTVVLQEAYGDYSHATSNISLANAKKYSVVSNVGISLNSSVTSYYDSINVSEAGWEGVW